MRLQNNGHWMSFTIRFFEVPNTGAAHAATKRKENKWESWLAKWESDMSDGLGCGASCFKVRQVVQPQPHRSNAETGLVQHLQSIAPWPVSHAGSLHQSQHLYEWHPSRYLRPTCKRPGPLLNRLDSDWPWQIWCQLLLGKFGPSRSFGKTPAWQKPREQSTSRPWIARRSSTPESGNVAPASDPTEPPSYQFESSLFERPFPNRHCQLQNPPR